MNESAVNHSIRLGCAAPQTFQVFEIAAMRLGAGGGERLGARIRASHADHLMTSAIQLLDNGGTDKTCRACDEYTHKTSP